MTVGWWWIEGGGGQGGGGMGLSMVTFSPRDYMIWKPSSSHFRCYSFHLLLNTHTHTHTHKLSSVPFLSLFLSSYYWSSCLYFTPLPYSTLVMECLDAKINKLYNLWTTMGMPMDDISVTERLQVSFFIQYMDIRDSSSYISMYLQNWIDS